MKNIKIDLIKIESHKKSHQDVFISNDLYKELNDKYSEKLPIRSFNHRKTPTRAELGIKTYLPDESWRLFKVMGLRVLEKKEKGFNSYIITENYVTREQFKKLGYKEVVDNN